MHWRVKRRSFEPNLNVTFLCTREQQLFVIQKTRTQGRGFGRHDISKFIGSMVSFGSNICCVVTSIMENKISIPKVILWRLERLYCIHEKKSLKKKQFCLFLLWNFCSPKFAAGTQFDRLLSTNLSKTLRFRLPPCTHSCHYHSDSRSAR